MFNDKYIFIDPFQSFKETSIAMMLAQFRWLRRKAELFKKHPLKNYTKNFIYDLWNEKNPVFSSLECIVRAQTL